MAELALLPYSFVDCVPHARPMALLDDDLFYAPGRLKAVVTIQADALFADDQGVPAWVGLEYMAQAGAAYAGARARLAGESVKLGFLVGSRRYVSTLSRFRLGQRLVIEVVEEVHNPEGLSSLACSISAGATVIARANLNVFQPKDPAQYLEESRHG